MNNVFTYSSTQDKLALLGRILLALMFVLAGFSKIGGFAGVSGHIASKGLPMPQMVAIGTIALELIGGSALILGWRTRMAALALALFTVLASLIFHAFWSVPVEQQTVQKLMFMKNMAVAGGMLVLVAFGPGRLSLDGRKSI